MELKTRSQTIVEAIESLEYERQEQPERFDEIQEQIDELCNELYEL